MEIHSPLMMTVKEFARLHCIGETTVRDCLAGLSKNYPPLRAKRSQPGRGGQIYITAEQAAEWRAALPEA
jgi:predicted transcriptional regulator